LSEEVGEFLKTLDDRVSKVEEAIGSLSKIDELVKAFESFKGEVEEKFKALEESKPQPPIINLETFEQYPPAYGRPPEYPRYPIPKLIDLIRKLSEGNMDMTVGELLAKLGAQESQVLPTKRAKESTSIDDMSPEEVSKLVDETYEGNIRNVPKLKR